MVGSSWGIAQDAVFSARVSSDSILLGNYIKLTFLLENTAGTDFDAPDFEHFDVVSGPNISSSTSIINGVVSQSVRYTYYLSPRDIGEYYITPASIYAAERQLTTEPIAIQVLPNPDGIQQSPDTHESPSSYLFRGFPPLVPDAGGIPQQQKKKKKRKTYKL